MKNLTDIERHYAPEMLKRSMVLLEVLSRYAKPSDSILEIGGSYGRNLEVLQKEGFKDLTNLEPDEKAIKKVKKGIKTISGKIEDKIKDLKSYDIIFTMSSLMMIKEPPFKEIANKVKKFLITMEGEKGSPSPGKVFDRNYYYEFQLDKNYGLEQVEWQNGFSGEYSKIRVFKKEA